MNTYANGAMQITPHVIMPIQRNTSSKSMYMLQVTHSLNKERKHHAPEKKPSYTDDEQGFVHNQHSLEQVQELGACNQFPVV